MDPVTRYARSGDTRIAYQVAGDGPMDIVFAPGWVSNVEVSWEIAPFSIIQQFLASIGRLIIFDKRGTGLSDPVDHPPTLEERIDDIRAVMDAAGSERAALYGISEGGPMAILYAATFPNRVTSLVLYGSAARFKWAEDNPYGKTDAELDGYKEQIDRSWGEGATADWLMQWAGDDSLLRAQWGRWERTGASPKMAIALIDACWDIDVRELAPVIDVPTVVIHCTDDRLVSVECGRLLAELIPNARFVEVPGGGHVPDALAGRVVVEELNHFLTGTRAEPEPDRVLATVLFTDIADSTRRTAELGDAAWREVLDRHDRLVRSELERWQGREIKSLGDGFVATFDGPARAVRCAQAIVEGARSLGLDVRAGLHAGECELRGSDIGGMAVNIGARVAQRASPGEVLVSSTVKDLVIGSGLRFSDRRSRQLKGVEGRWSLFVLGGDDDARSAAAAPARI